MNTDSFILIKKIKKSVTVNLDLKVCSQLELIPVNPQVCYW